MRGFSRKSLCVCCVLAICAGTGAALDFSVRLSPSLVIPADSETSDYFGVSGAVFLDPSVDLFDCVSVGPELFYMVTPLVETGTYPQVFGAAFGSSLFWAPLSRLQLRAGGSAGLYEMAYEKSTFINSWWRAYAEAGFRFSPSFTVSGTAGIIRCNQSVSEPMFSGFTAGISAQLSMASGPVEGNVSVSLEQGEPVFPLFYGIYREYSIGTLAVTNRESAEIRNVSVSFRAGNYTSSLITCGTVDILGRGKTTELPLYADFSETINNFTENGKIPGEVVITYELLGASMQASKTVVIPVYNRNTLRWTDAAALAAFISPNSPEVLEYSKYIAGIARDQLRTGLNRNMQFAMYLFEGFNVGGLSLSNDETTPYLTYHLDASLLDYVQYPFQTLSYRSGDYDDLGILFAAVLESVGIKSAIIPLRDDLIVAFSLGISAEDAASLFDSTDSLITIGDEVWIPLSFGAIREGFINSWYSAKGSLNEAFAGETPPEVIDLRDAWKSYPPAGISGDEAKFAKPEESAVVKAVETDLLRYITAEFGPKIRKVQAQIRTEGGSSALYNQLGLLYVRAGMYAEAKGEYRKSAALKSAPAMVNLGNIAILERDYAAAAGWFRKALEVQPESKSARTGLERAETELAQ